MSEYIVRESGKNLCEEEARTSELYANRGELAVQLVERAVGGALDGRRLAERERRLLAALRRLRLPLRDVVRHEELEQCAAAVLRSIRSHIVIFSTVRISLGYQFDAGKTITLHNL